MLSAVDLSIAGRSGPILPPTSLEVFPGDVVLVQADGQDTRTVLALALTGRMRPSSGFVHWGHDDDIAKLRRRSALVDAPGVNEPERHLRVADLVAEDLALVPRPVRVRPQQWLQQHGFQNLARSWVDEVPPQTRLAMLAALALTDPAVELLVVDSPDRHTANPGAWLPLLQDAAATGRHGHAVVATVAKVPAHHPGTAVVIPSTAQSQELP
jgi:hypothetical protein